MMGDSKESVQLQASIAALEAQRSILGDAIVEPALAALHEKLAALEAQPQAEQQRKLATVLFMDMAGHTSLIQGLDPEENLAIIDNALTRLAKAIDQYGGQVVRFQGDGFKAVFGLPTARENDAESAVRAALAIQDTAQVIAGELAQSRGLAGFSVRVGIDTGLVIGGGLTEGEETVSGLTVNLASRLENVAEPGTILISHNTYRQIRGVFDVQPREPIALKGFAEPVLTYVVLRAKPRAFRLHTRGIEGIETRMVGRERELAMLQEAFADVSEMHEARLITVVAEAGLGKSRLLDEFSQWLELQPEFILYFKGRATPALQSTPYDIFRDLFAFRFEILDSDSPETALTKFREGMAPVLDPDQADIIGHWLGFNFAASPAVGRLAGGPEFAAAAQAHLNRYFRRLADEQPIVMFLEDIHWADDASLDLILNLATALSASSMLIICAARPSLFERRAYWAEGHPAANRLDLSPLSHRFSRVLIGEILQRAPTVPDTLLDIIIDDAEGNPFYIEELVKMLLDDGTIIRADDNWRVDASRLDNLHVPPTLTGILQARLDNLPGEVRATVQRAAVVGRLFWDTPVAHLTGEAVEAIHPILDSAREREIVLRHEQSSIAGTIEYSFRHYLLREVAYETVLLKLRRLYHAQVADWLEVHVGERLSEHLGLVAEHCYLAGQNERAAIYFERAGKQALQTGANQAAYVAYRRALDLRTSAGERNVAVAEDHIRLGEACWHLGKYEPATEDLTLGLQLAEEVGDKNLQIVALYFLAQTTDSQGNYFQGQEYLQQALDLARSIGSDELARTLYGLGGNAWRRGDLDAAEAFTRESLEIAQQQGYKLFEGMATNIMGLIAGVRYETGEEKNYYLRCLEIAREIGDLFLEAVALANLGVAAYMQKSFEQAAHYFEACLEIYRDLGRQESVAMNLGNLASAQIELNDLPGAWRSARESLLLSHQLGALPRILQSLQTIAQILFAQGQTRQALDLMGLVRHHPSAEFQLVQEIDDMVHSLDIDPVEMELGFATGEALNLETVVAKFLAKTEI